MTEDSDRLATLNSLYSVGGSVVGLVSSPLGVVTSFVWAMIGGFGNSKEQKLVDKIMQEVVRLIKRGIWDERLREIGNGLFTEVRNIEECCYPSDNDYNV